MCIHFFLLPVLLLQFLVQGGQAFEFNLPRIAIPFRHVEDATEMVKLAMQYLCISLPLRKFLRQIVELHLSLTSLSLRLLDNRHLSPDTEAALQHDHPLAQVV